MADLIAVTIKVSFYYSKRENIGSASVILYKLATLPPSLQDELCQLVNLETINCNLAVLDSGYRPRLSIVNFILLWMLLYWESYWLVWSKHTIKLVLRKQKESKTSQVNIQLLNYDKTLMIKENHIQTRFPIDRFINQRGSHQTQDGRFRCVKLGSEEERRNKV